MSNSRVGFMQGRLSPKVDGKIQAFPWMYWRDEFLAAERIGFRIMEWTLDNERLHENPLLTESGRADIFNLMVRHRLTVPSLTGDCFMQAPFWKATGDTRSQLLQDFDAVAEACAVLGIWTMVVPLVDNGRLENDAQKANLLDALRERTTWLRALRMRVVVESDFAPKALADFIAQLDADVFGINYDMGNSAAAGFDVKEELAAYGCRVTNVHVKDRLRGGTTVPILSGDTDFDAVFAALASIGFDGVYILQTARAEDSSHADVIAKYRDLVDEWIVRHGA